MEKNRSRFTKWLTPNQTPSKCLTRAKSVFTKRSVNSLKNDDLNKDKKKCKSLDRMEIDICNDGMELLRISNSKQIFSSLQPEIYASLDSSSSDMDVQSNCSSSSYSQQDLINIKKELVLRTDTVTKGFEILDIIYKSAMTTFTVGTEKFNIIERIFKDLRCISNFHELYQKELNSVINHDLPLSMVFTNQIINSALNWYKIFYTTFEARNQLLTSFYQQDFQFKLLADKAIVVYTKTHTENNLISLPWILSSIKDSLFHFEILLARYSDSLNDNMEKYRINDAIKLIQNILRSCNMQCDYNDFMKTQHQYSMLSITDPLSPSVRFVHKGLVQKVCRQNSKIRHRMIFLFTHMIFITSKSTQFHIHKLKHQLNLSLCNFSILNNDKTSPSKRGFRLNCGEFTCEFLMEKESDFFTWIEKLNSTICQAKLRKNSFDRKITRFILKSDETENQNKSLGIEAPSWQRPNATNFCNGFNCTTRFKGNLKIQNCSADGLIYCEDCLTYSTFLTYTNKCALTCRECFQIISNDEHKTDALERQVIKRRRIRREGIIKGWLTISQPSSSKTNTTEYRQRLFCVLNSDCTIYTYELPEDKYHHLPIRVIRAVFCSSNNTNDNTICHVAYITKKGKKYSLEADTNNEAVKWIHLIKLSQIENLQNV